MQAVINRPWLTSFEFRAARFSENKLDQIHKLSRNFVASLSLGCPSAKHVATSRRTMTIPSDNEGRARWYKNGWSTTEVVQDTRAEYKAWVSDWKKIYAEVSRLIRLMKSYRKTVHYPKPSVELRDAWLTTSRFSSNESLETHLHKMSQLHLYRLQETAQVLLNARYNAKLAAGERRRRELEVARKELVA